MNKMNAVEIKGLVRQCCNFEGKGFIEAIRVPVQRVWRDVQSEISRCTHDFKILILQVHDF